VRFAFDDDQLEIAGAVKDLLVTEVASVGLRAAQADPAARAKIWQALADQGVLAMLVPREAGGLTLGWETTVLVLQEIGYSGVPGAFPDTMAVAPLLLSGLDHPDARALLERIATGDAMVGVSFGRGDRISHPDELDAVIDASTQQLALAPRQNWQANQIPSMDEGWPTATVMPTNAEPSGLGSVSAEVRTAAWDGGVLATAAILVGVTQRMLHLTRQYTLTREQFGRPIGTFQSVQHQLVDAFVKAEFAAPLVHKAAWAMAQETPGRSWDVAAAKRAAAIASHHAARTALQLHGAIGYTWEYDLSIWLKREQTLTSLYGNAAWHTRRLTEELMRTVRHGASPEPVLPYETV